jgi:hypothetical protein
MSGLSNFGEFSTAKVGVSKLETGIFPKAGSRLELKRIYSQNKILIPG